MGKEGELWDDSALIDAFDNAMSKYKRMHGKKNSEASVSAVADQTAGEAIKHRDAGENCNATSNTRTETDEAKGLPPVKENDAVCSLTTEPLDLSTSMRMQDKQDGNEAYSDLQGTQDYNRLLSQYYEVEDKRQKILQQLQQFASWNYQGSAEGSSAAAQRGTYCTSQEYPILTCQASQSTVVCSCCPYVCQSLVTPCTSYPCCSLGGTCIAKTSIEPNGAMTHGNLPKVFDDDIVKTAMGAAERAISSMTAKASINHNVNEEDKEKKIGGGEMNQNASCDTDLTVLLNAWYSAGFHTGKYLVEQSIGKKRQ